MTEKKWRMAWMMNKNGMVHRHVYDTWRQKSMDKTFPDGAPHTRVLVHEWPAGCPEPGTEVRVEGWEGMVWKVLPEISYNGLIRCQDPRSTHLWCYPSEFTPIESEPDPVIEVDADGRATIPTGLPAGRYRLEVER